MSQQNLRKDLHGHPIQAFFPDPAKTQVPQAITGPLSLATLLDIPDCAAIRLHSTAALTRYFNTDTTKTFPVLANTDTLIYLDETVTDVVISGTATVSIEAM